MDPFLSDRHARWHPVDLSLFPLRRYAPPTPHRFYILHFMLRLAQEQYGPLFV